MKTRAELFQEAMAADTAWSKALIEKFGNKAGDARYDKRGASTPELEALRDAKRTADDLLFGGSK